MVLPYFVLQIAFHISYFNYFTETWGIESLLCFVQGTRKDLSAVLDMSTSIQRSLKVKLPLFLTKYIIKMYPYLNKHHSMKMYLGSGGIAPHILNLGIRGR